MFKIETHASARTSVMEVMAIEKDSDVKIGAALVITDGKLAVAAGAAKPTHVAARDAQAEDETLHVYRVLDTDEWQTTIKNGEADAVIGEKYTVSPDGQQITATTGGAFEVSRAWHDGETYYACGRFV